MQAITKRANERRRYMNKWLPKSFFVTARNGSEKRHPEPLTLAEPKCGGCGQRPSKRMPWRSMAINFGNDDAEKFSFEEASRFVVVANKLTLSAQPDQVERRGRM
ncbi:hypothetical protein PY254_17110 [Rhodanobacter sp. AS-Z3]|uniref:hypothetical protein n=1 Tax=Rhodanobacter sp. AS-Z3 TaxID=3031330 RepID=UPI00247AF480|nr:hypothetical protein [Rhodanobacter sp. AS-Z3]WEN14926.1 hypothetical protein PY254_17110 [Rhodanobacter sp. AS-Z3]